MKTLLIDDMRDIKADVIARTFDEGIQALKTNSKFDVLYLDHDLGEDEFTLIDGEKYPKTGYGIMVFLENNPQLLPTKINLVTSNPVGRRNMQIVINKLYGAKS
jgi:hypothetical protein